MDSHSSWTLIIILGFGLVWLLFIIIKNRYYFKRQNNVADFDQILENAGYTVRFIFSNPYSLQPYSRTELISKIEQNKNRLLCEQYKNIAKDSPNIYETIKVVKQNPPELYNLIINMGRSAELFKKHNLDKTP